MDKDNTLLNDYYRENNVSANDIEGRLRTLELKVLHKEKVEKVEVKFV